MELSQSHVFDEVNIAMPCPMAHLGQGFTRAELQLSRVFMTDSDLSGARLWDTSKKVHVVLVLCFPDYILLCFPHYICICLYFYVREVMSNVTNVEMNSLWHTDLLCPICSW